MRKHKELSEDLIRRIVNLHEVGRSFRDIFKQLLIPSSSVQTTDEYRLQVMWMCHYVWEDFQNSANCHPRIKEN